MIPIPNAEQIRQWDAYTIANEPIASIDLMERACNAFVNCFVSKYGNQEKIGVVCGTGNNGGDGLGIARLLLERSFDVKVFVIDGKSRTDEFKTNYERLPKNIVASRLEDVLNPSSILIDAIFGSGLSRPADGVYAESIKKINAVNAIRIAVDVPSGLLLDAHSSGEIIKAKHTITFQVPKLAFMFPENAEYVGEWHAVDIGLHEKFFDVKRIFPPNYYIDGGFIRSVLQTRAKFSHKGDYGRALLVAGSLGKMGASILAARATLRTGAGLLTVHVPRCGYDIIQTAVPEAMAAVDNSEDYFSDVGDPSKYDVIGVGPGIGVTSSTTAGLRKLMEAGKPMVIDADALNIISQNRDLRQLIPGGSILTPHPGEFKRFVGEWTDDFHRLELQRKLSKELNCIIVLKGAHTSVTYSDNGALFNSTGNPGMAKGGSGDVLTGVILGLLSQGHHPWEAALIGVYVHGLAGDLAAAKTGQTSLIASDIVEFLGQSFGR